MSPQLTGAIGTVSSFPRMSGDEPLQTQDWNQIAKFSPHERG